MDVNIREVKAKNDLKVFIFLPEKVHANHANWVHPVYMDEWKYFDPKKNEAFSYSDTVLLLAFRGEEAVGRIMGIINSRYNEYRKEKTARFGYLETEEDEEVVRSLLSYVEDWARKKGMTKIIGPYGFSDQDPEGFLIEGFENRATIATYYNFEWMPRFVEKQGYTKDVDYFVYKLDVPREFPEFYKRIYERAQRKGNFEVVEFCKRKELKPWIKPILHLMNECYTGSSIYGYAPLDEKEMENLAKRYLPVLDPRFVKAVKKDDEVVAFIVGMPDITEGIRKAKGRLFPFGFLKILRAAKKTKQLDLLLGAIKEKYRGRGLDVLMGVKTILSAHEAGLEMIDTHHELEENAKVRAEMERMGGKVYKRFRVFQKVL
jgi:predicted GNAT family acetyltransferase/GNAT superfamily N-acetyltransferase